MIHKTRSSSKHKRGSNVITIAKLGHTNLETMGASSIRSNDERENVELNSNLERLFAARALHGDIYWKIFLQRVEILLNGANGKEGFSEFTKNSDMIWKRANEVQIAKIRATAAIDERFSSRVMIHKTRSSSKHKRGSNMVITILETTGTSPVREHNKDEREQNVIFNLVGLLSQTSDDVSSEKTKKILKRKRTGFARSTQNLL